MENPEELDIFKEKISPLLRYKIKNARRLKTLGISSSVAFFLLSFLVLSPAIDKQNIEAATGTASAATTSLTFTNLSSEARLVMSPTSAEGTFASSDSTNAASFVITTNNYTGYILSIKANDDEGKLVNVLNGDYYFETIPSSLTKDAFADADNITLNGKWGYKPSRYLDADTDTVINNTGIDAIYLPSPTTSPTILDRTTTANSIDNNLADATNYQIAVGARANHSFKTGSYTKSFTLTVLANPAPYVIYYNANTADMISNMPTASTTGAITDTAITIADNVPVREHHTFLGWCNVLPVNNNGVDSCTGTNPDTGATATIYNPNGDGTNLTYGIDQTTANTATLYAMWEKDKDAIQDITPDMCTTIPTLVYDNRDGEIYTIQKLADGNCWLLDNLRLDPASVPLDKLKGNTNALDETLEYLKGVKTGTSSDKYAISAAADWVDAGLNKSSYSDPLVYAADKNNEITYGDGNSKVGVYYNFCAASAGSYCWDSSATPFPPNSPATEDVCPAGWRMPTGDESGEYGALYTAYGKNAADFKNALRTPLSGYFYYGSVTSRNSYGYFWSSTYNKLLSVSSSINVQSGSNSYYGFSMRCILDNQKTISASYNKNTADSVGNMPSSQIANTNSIRKAEVPQNIPTRSGYAFIGWCNTHTTSSNNIDSCPGETFLPSASYGADQVGQSPTFYAMWAAYASLTAIQNITISTCSTSPMLVYDTRDNEVYTIQKLADGKCWLLDNLRLGGESPITLTPSDTNIASNFTLPAGGEWTSSYEAKIVTKYKNLVPPDGYQGKAGVSYNFCAVSAGSQCSSGDAVYDVCPKNWRLPSAGEFGKYGEVVALNMYYPVESRDFINILHVPFSGAASMMSDWGKSGYSWTSTASNIWDYYVMSASSNGVGSYYIDEKHYVPVRCVLNDIVPYSISYDKNTTDPVSGIPATQSGNTNSANIILTNSTPSRSGYSFIGWCDTRPTNSNGIDSCSGNINYPGNYYNIDFTQTRTNTSNFYAMWASHSSIVALQNTTTASCPTTPTLAYDTRDNEVYTIQKLADGKCWLLDNLRLDPSTTGTLTPANTNIISNWTPPENIGTAFGENYTIPKVYAAKKNALPYEAGTVRYNGRLGVYYNYCAATAGTYCYESTVKGGNATYDICPSGWRLPTGTYRGEAQILYGEFFNSNIVDFVNALQINYSGKYDGYGYAKNIVAINSYTVFWSSTGGDRGSGVYVQEVNTYNLYPFLADRSYYGYSVRCVAK